MANTINANTLSLLPSLPANVSALVAVDMPSNTGELINVENLAAQINGLRDDIVLADIGSITGSGESVTTTKVVSGLTENMILAGSILSNPAAQTGDWSIQVNFNEVSVIGPINGTTNLKLLFVLPRVADVTDPE